MKPAGHYVADAYNLSTDAFAAAHGGFFLVHTVPTVSPAADDVRDEWGQAMAFVTSYGPRPPTTPDIAAAYHAVREFQVSEVRKRKGNPFPDRVSVGRARNCDVVLRYSYVSKLHAHFVAADGSAANGAAFSLVDQNSSNGTAINGTPLEPGQPTLVASGDEVTLASLRMRLMDAERFTAFLKRESQRPRGDK